MHGKNNKSQIYDNVEPFTVVFAFVRNSLEIASSITSSVISSENSQDRNENQCYIYQICNISSDPK